MSHEQPTSHSEDWGASEEALAMIGEFTILPLEILGSLASEAFELGSSSE